MPHGCHQHQLHTSHSQSEQDSMSLPPGVGLTLSGILETQPHSSGGQRPFSHSLLRLLPKVVLQCEHLMHTWRVCTSTINCEFHLFQGG